METRTKLILGIGCLVISLSLTMLVPGFTEEPPANIYDLLQSNTVVVVTPKGHGSGWVVGAHANLIITCAHVVQDFDDILLMDWTGDIFVATVVELDMERDVAILKTARALKATGIGFGIPELGMDVWACGAPFSTRLQGTITKGIISGFRDGLLSPHSIQTDVAINPGNSGGPVVDSNGLLVGMSQATIGDSPCGVNLLVPVYDILDVLNPYLDRS